MLPAINVPFTDLGAMAHEVWPQIQETYVEALLTRPLRRRRTGR